MDHYQKAIAADPEGPLGYAGLADAWSLLGLYALDPPKEAFPLAKQAALKALQLDPELAEAHSALGTARFFHEWDWPAASSDFERAIALNPGYVSCYHIFSSALSAIGRHEEALEKARASLQLDPFSLVALLNVGWLHFYARRYDDAIAECRKALALDPKFLRAHELLGMALAGKRKYPEALAAARHVMAEHDGGPRGLAVCGYIFAVSGSRDEARKTVDTLRGLAEHRYVPALSIAFVSGALGKLDTAFGWLQRAFDEQDSLLVWLRVDPRLDNLRPDRRFRELEERVGLRLWGRSAGLR
jgi:Flp pilus assembly protein TadD